MSTRGSARRRGRVTRPLAVAALLAITLLATPVALLAHARLTKSAPSSGARLAGPPTAVTLWFSEAPELAFTRLTLLGPDSVQVALGEVQRVSNEPLAVSAVVRSTLAPGEYTIVWQTAAADGHPTRGRFSFVVLPSSGPTAPANPSPTLGSHRQTVQRGAQRAPTEDTAGGELGAESPAYVAVRWVSFAALLALIGLMSFRWFVMPRAVRIAARHQRGPALRAASGVLVGRGARAGAIAASALLAATVARLFVQTIAMHGSVDLATMRQMVTQTHWGSAWLVQAATTVVALIALIAVRRTVADTGRDSRAAWTVATAAVLILAFTPALGGHAAAAPRLTALAIAADGLHVLGAGGWLGALLVTLTVGIPVVLAAESPDRGGVVADLVNAFSPTALAFATVVVFTGLFAAWLHLGSFAALWGSSYGRTLLLKLGVLIPVLGTGAYNWLRVRPALGKVAAASRVRRSAAVELAVGGLVLLVTAVLVAVQPPT